MADTLPIIALTTGDPAGIGPEITLKALAEGSWHGRLRPIVVGDAAVANQVIAGCALPLTVRTVQAPGDAASEPGTVDVIDCGVVTDVPYGTMDARCGKAALTYIETACALVTAGEVHGMVTGPISKEATWAAGSRFPGHTEMLAHLFGVPEHDAVTMFLLDKLRIFFLTRHHSLLDAVARLDIDTTARFLARVAEVIGEIGVTEPRLALAALNPHGGENGKLGTEEQRILAPAVAKARSANLDVTGPIPADAVFYQARQGRYDGVVAVHHDQGHIAAKTLDFFGTVACELGLPVIRTTVDHGTAFDIAGKWVADARGQTAAMRVAAELAPLVLHARATGRR